MWSDPTPPERLRELVAQVRSVVPEPSRTARSYRMRLPSRATVDQVADLLQGSPEFCLLNRNRILRRPLAVIYYSGRQMGFIESRLSSTPVWTRAYGFDWLQAVLDACQGTSGALLAGYISYDLASEIEDLRSAPSEGSGKFWFGLYDSALTFEDGGWILSGTDAWRGMDDDDAKTLLQRAESGSAGWRYPRNDAEAPAGITSTPDRCAFKAAVERTVARIHAGEIFQTNLCRSIQAPLASGSQWDFYKRMRLISPARYEAFIRTSRREALLSVSPELFLKVHGGVVESQPIKGTRPRGASIDEDRRLAEELATSEKDRAELAMIVDVTRNDLARVCQPGSVEVLKHAELMTLPTVHHLFSTVRGRLREGIGPVQLLKAAFPAASISGAPKIEAMRIAMREEGHLRGPCMGAIGWISLDGDMELSVAIRTAFAEYGRVRYLAGCGITAGSVPADEYAESEHKAAAFIRALDDVTRTPD